NGSLRDLRDRAGRPVCERTLETVPMLRCVTTPDAWRTRTQRRLVIQTVRAALFALLGNSATSPRRSPTSAVAPIALRRARARARVPLGAADRRPSAPGAP